MTEGTRTTEAARAEQILTGLAVIGASALMLAAMGRAVVVLVLALGASYAIWLTRDDRPLSHRLLPVSLVAVLVQCVHPSEELWSGFYRAFPPVLGGEPWSMRQVLAFNLAWLAVFLAAAVGIQQRWRPAFGVSLFLAIGGGIGNGLGHLALTVRADGYFPGASTAPCDWHSGCSRGEFDVPSLAGRLPLRRSTAELQAPVSTAAG